MSIVNTLKKIFIPVLSVFAAHYVAANLYTRICAASGIVGFLTSLMTTGSPICNALLTIINTTHNSYAIILTSIVSVFIGVLTFTNTNHIANN